MIRPRTAGTHGPCSGSDGPPFLAAFSPRPRRAAFTLVELLVVVAILALLLAILSPSTKFVYETAQKVICQTRLHEMGEAALGFQNDHGRLVKIKTANGSFSDELLPYLTDHEFFHCPSEKPRSNAAKNHMRLDYGINHYGRGDPSHGGKKKFYNTMGYFANPSSNSPNHSGRVADSLVVYFSDADTDQSPEDIGGISRGTDEWPIQHSFQKYAHKRHLRGYNCAQLDSSTAWYPSQPPTNDKWFIPKY